MADPLVEMIQGGQGQRGVDIGQSGVEPGEPGVVGSGIAVLDGDSEMLGQGGVVGGDQTSLGAAQHLGRREGEHFGKPERPDSAPGPVDGDL